MTEFENEYFKMAVPAAIASREATEVPASITLAQGALESGWGLTQLAREANNFFGIKAGARAAPNEYIEFPTHEVVRGVSELEMAKFARYATVDAGFKAHGALLSMAPRYAPAMRVADDAAAFARELQACGYSTNPKYAEELMELVREFDLTQYDAPPDKPAAAAKVAA